MISSTATHALVLETLKVVVGAANVLAGASSTRRYRTGFRVGSGDALAVVRPHTLLQLWRVLEICCQNDVIIILQAANTSLTGGSVPDGNDYDRPVVIINTLHLSRIDLLGAGRQVLCHAGSTLFELEDVLAAVSRRPHSVIGSSCIGASVIGGIANNSGGALVRRGPAYTELALFARRGKDGSLELVNNLGIDLGRSPEEILGRLDDGKWAESDISWEVASASDTRYAEKVRDIGADTPARYNADPSNLFEASGSAGKLAIFAVRLDTFPAEENQQTFYIGANDPAFLTSLRRHFLANHRHLPVSAEYLHRDCFDSAQRFGKDTFAIIDRFGTKRMPGFFALKGRVDAILGGLPRGAELSDFVLQACTTLLPALLPDALMDFRRRYEHYLILRMEGEGVSEARSYLEEASRDIQLSDWFLCDARQTKAAFLLRFSAAGAAIRQAIVREGGSSQLVALDLALPRNATEWLEELPAELRNRCADVIYYGHFFCQVFHQDYILKKGVDPMQFKKDVLAFQDSRGAKYPAEHNVGNLYKAEDQLADFYKDTDPTNSFNAGIGKMSKFKFYGCDCCV